jgi:hypothetical protein
MSRTHRTRARWINEEQRYKLRRHHTGHVPRERWLARLAKGYGQSFNPDEVRRVVGGQPGS